MKGLSSWDPQENGTNGGLGLRGRKGYAQISIWSSLALACKERNEEEEEEVPLSWVEEKVAGNEWKILNVISEGDDLNGESGKMWGPIQLRLKMAKSWSCGPRMKSTKKTKMILIKSSFQKVYFWHGSEISKSGLIFKCEKTVLPLGLKN